MYVCIFDFAFAFAFVVVVVDSNCYIPICMFRIHNMCVYAIVDSQFG